MSSKRIIYDQHPLAFEYINKGLMSEFSTSNSKVISHVRFNDDQSISILAVVAYSSFLKHSVEMSIVAEPSEWATRQFIQAAYDYPFFQEGKEKVVAIVRTNNSVSIDTLKRLGHTNEGCMRDYQGVDKDCYIYGLTKRQYIAGRFAPKLRKQQYE